MLSTPCSSLRAGGSCFSAIAIVEKAAFNFFAPKQ